MFESWASSPRDVPPLGSDAMAPPSLRRVASGQGAAEPPKMTRSVSSYLRDISESPFAQPSGQAELGSAGGSSSRHATTVPQALAQGGVGMMGPPSVGHSRQISENPMPSLGRSVSSFVRDFIDESASLSSAPPANALPSLGSGPPSLSRGGASFSELMDLPGIGGFGADALMPGDGLPALPPGLSREPSLTGGRSPGRRASPRR